MRVLVCGGRDFDDAGLVGATLDGYWERSRHMVVIQGGASGADRLARAWCVRRLVMYENYPAAWKTHGKAAGPIRNQHMIDEGRPEIVVAFPGGRGTADMVRRSREAGIPVIEIGKGGEVDV
jgi:hypothetical protein